MPNQPPPSRYRVVERGRRLEVIDTATGNPVRTAAAASRASDAPVARWPTLPEQEGFDSRALLVTHRWYDSKAPRRLLLDPGTTQAIGIARGVAIVALMVLVLIAIAAPAVLGLALLPAALLGRPVRERLRAAATGWLDRFDAPPGR